MFKGFANLRANLTLLVFLRRISRSLERANKLAETRLALDHPDWQVRGGLEKQKVTMLKGVDVGSVAEWNKAWLEKHPVVENADAEYDID